MNLNLFPENAVTPRGIVNLRVHRPELVTKELKLSVLPSGTKRIRLSTNFLPLMGFEPGMRTTVEDLGVNQGLKVSYSPTGTTKIYQRSYTVRKNNPIEAQIDIQNQMLIDRAIPNGTERLHFTLKNGSLLIKPLFNNTFSIRKAIREAESPFNSFVAMSSGIDMHSLRSVGFDIHSLLEYRPQEARDKTDFTETGALNALTNAPVTNLFNEDISKINMKMVEDIVLKSSSPIGLLHLSLACDDYSLSKNPKSKAESIDNLSTTVDQVYDGLRLVESVRPSVVLIENVPGFQSSASGELLRVKLRKWGYIITDGVLDARNYSGLTSRKRYYLIASIWPGMCMPAEVSEALKQPLWSIIKKHLHECRDVTHTGTVHRALVSGRSRVISSSSAYAPTVMKSQARQATDSIYIEHEGKYLLPSEKLLRALCGFPETVQLKAVSSTIASEIIGQSIEYPMHHRILQNIYDHIKLNTCS